MGHSKPRRFGAHEVEKGPFKGGSHVATKRYSDFSSALHYLADYLNRRLLPQQPEQLAMVQIITNLQNVMEHEAEILIDVRAQAHDHDATALAQRINRGYVSFKSKCDWLLEHGLISQAEWDVMDEIRDLRNISIHARPSRKRVRHQYRGKPVLSHDSLRSILVHTERVVRSLRAHSGHIVKWATVPPGYATELGWPEDDRAFLDGPLR